jgi:hypothetical protein
MANCAMTPVTELERACSRTGSLGEVQLRAAHARVASGAAASKTIGSMICPFAIMMQFRVHIELA